jgi:hypothetical protein
MSGVECVRSHPVEIYVELLFGEAKRHSLLRRMTASKQACRFFFSQASLLSWSERKDEKRQSNAQAHPGGDERDHVDHSEDPAAGPFNDPNYADQSEHGSVLSRSSRLYSYDLGRREVVRSRQAGEKLS